MSKKIQCDFFGKLKELYPVIIFFAICIGIVFMISKAISEPPKLWETFPIVSLDMEKDIQGDFVLGCRHIAQRPVYYFYIKLDNGNYKLVSSDSFNTINTADVELKISDDEEPKVEIYENFLYSKIVLIVPSNTIRQVFNGDLK